MFRTAPALVLACLATHAAAQSGMVSTTGTLSDISDFQTYDSFQGEPLGGFLFGETPDGLMKFDPSLGQLTGIEVSVEVFVGYDLFLYPDFIADPSFEHSATVSFLFDPEFFVGYTPSSEPNIIRTLAAHFFFDPIVIDCFGFESDEFPCSNQLSAYEEFTDVDPQDFAGRVDLADFTGTGPLTAVQFYGFIPDAAIFELDNLDEGYADLDMYADEGFVTITYHYSTATPSCIADVTTTNTNPGDVGYGEPDGTIDGNDLSYFVEFWLAEDILSDVTTTNTNPGDTGYGQPDGTVDGNDLSFFVETWLGQCL